MSYLKKIILVAVVSNSRVVHCRSDTIVTSHQSENIATQFSPNGTFIIRVEYEDGSFHHHNEIKDGQIDDQHI